MDGLIFCGVPIGCVLTYGLVSDFKRHAREFRRDQLGWQEYAARRGFHYTGGAMRRLQPCDPPIRRIARASIHSGMQNRPVLVLPVPGDNTL